MTSRDFAYWLQGYFEISDKGPIDSRQVDIIKKHLNLVFKHEIDPSMGGSEHQAELNDIHNKPDPWDYKEEPWKQQYGPCPHPGWECNIHGWYNPEEGTPRC